MYLSVIIPAYNEAQRIGPTLQTILAYLQAQPYAAEVIVVDDGSSDGTAELVTTCQGRGTPIFLLRHAPNRGKGFTARRGFLQARGAFLLFTDADLSTPIEEVEKLLAAIETGADIAIGSRALPDSCIEMPQRWTRRLMGRCFNLLVRVLAVPGILDTQCGFKLFRREAALAICQRLTSARFGFDVEMLVLVRRLGYQVREVPVRWRDAPQSRVRLVRGSLLMLGELWRLRGAG